MASLTWSNTKPTKAGWYWCRGPLEKAEPFIVFVDEAGQFQWPDGGFQEVSLTKGQWAGLIEEPQGP